MRWLDRAVLCCAADAVLADISPQTNPHLLQAELQSLGKVSAFAKVKAEAQARAEVRATTRLSHHHHHPSQPTTAPNSIARTAHKRIHPYLPQAAEAERDEKEMFELMMKSKKEAGERSREAGRARAMQRNAEEQRRQNQALKDQLKMMKQALGMAQAPALGAISEDGEATESNDEDLGEQNEHYQTEVERLNKILKAKGIDAKIAKFQASTYDSNATRMQRRRRVSMQGSRQTAAIASKTLDQANARRKKAEERSKIFAAYAAKARSDIQTKLGGIAVHKNTVFNSLQALEAEQAALAPGQVLPADKLLLLNNLREEMRTFSVKEEALRVELKSLNTKFGSSPEGTADQADSDEVAAQLMAVQTELASVRAQITELEAEKAAAEARGETLTAEQVKVLDALVLRRAELTDAEHTLQSGSALPAAMLLELDLRTLGNTQQELMEALAQAEAHGETEQANEIRAQLALVEQGQRDITMTLGALNDQSAKDDRTVTAEMNAMKLEASSAAEQAELSARMRKVETELNRVRALKDPAMKERELELEKQLAELQHKLELSKEHSAFQLANMQMEARLAIQRAEFEASIKAMQSESSMSNELKEQLARAQAESAQKDRERDMERRLAEMQLSMAQQKQEAEKAMMMQQFKSMNEGNKEMDEMRRQLAELQWEKQREKLESDYAQRIKALEEANARLSSENVDLKGKTESYEAKNASHRATEAELLQQLEAARRQIESGALSSKEQLLDLQAQNRRLELEAARARAEVKLLKEEADARARAEQQALDNALSEEQQKVAAAEAEAANAARRQAELEERERVAREKAEADEAARKKAQAEAEAKMEALFDENDFARIRTPDDTYEQAHAAQKNAKRLGALVTKMSVAITVFVGTWEKELRIEQDRLKDDGMTLAHDATSKFLHNFWTVIAAMSDFAEQMKVQVADPLSEFYVRSEKVTSQNYAAGKKALKDLEAVMNKLDKTQEAAAKEFDALEKRRETWVIVNEQDKKAGEKHYSAMDKQREKTLKACTVYEGQVAAANVCLQTYRRQQHAQQAIEHERLQTLERALKAFEATQAKVAQAWSGHVENTKKDLTMWPRKDMYNYVIKKTNNGKSRLQKDLPYDFPYKPAQLSKAVYDMPSMVFDCKLQQIINYQTTVMPAKEKHSVPFILKALLESVETTGAGLTTPGIFMNSDKIIHESGGQLLSEMKVLETCIRCHNKYKYNGINPHVPAALLTKWFKSVTEPLIPTSLYVRSATQ